MMEQSRFRAIQVGAGLVVDVRSIEVRAVDDVAVQVP
jgi:hypothetical protein